MTVIQKTENDTQSVRNEVERKERKTNKIEDEKEEHWHIFGCGLSPGNHYRFLCGAHGHTNCV